MLFGLVKRDASAGKRVDSVARAMAQAQGISDAEESAEANREDIVRVGERERAAGAG